jgi:DNA/RNA-binding domain of Phe-tRNA-synthetase-like protein
MLTIDTHPLLDLRAFTTTFPRPLGELTTPAAALAFLDPTATAPVRADDSLREAVRALLRHGGFRPAGRSKPASEYLLKAASDGRLESINPAVDICNAVSLHSGLPISVVDLDRTRPPLRVGIAAAGSSYVFNAAGQTIDLVGLLCLHDADGPCANAVKDAQRTKTGPATVRTLTLIWGTNARPGHAEAAERWYRSLLQGQGAATGMTNDE